MAEKEYQRIAATQEELKKEAEKLYRKHQAAGLMPLGSIVFKPRGDKVEVRFVSR